MIATVQAMVIGVPGVIGVPVGLPYPILSYPILPYPTLPVVMATVQAVVIAVVRRPRSDSSAVRYAFP